MDDINTTATTEPDAWSPFDMLITTETEPETKLETKEKEIPTPQEEEEKETVTEPEGISKLDESASNKEQSFFPSLPAPSKSTRPRKKARRKKRSNVTDSETGVKKPPAIQLEDPELKDNFRIYDDICGIGDLRKLSLKNYDTDLGDLCGEFGKGQLSSNSNSKPDVYSSLSFNRKEPSELLCDKPEITPRGLGFYYQEFAAVKLGTFTENIKRDGSTPSPYRDSDPLDTIVLASPEGPTQEEVDPFSGLKFIDEDEKTGEDCQIGPLSPEIQLLDHLPICPDPTIAKLYNQKEGNKNDISVLKIEGACLYTDIYQGVTVEQDASNSSSDNTIVTLTVSSSAAKDIEGLLKNLSKITSEELISFGSQSV